MKSANLTWGARVALTGVAALSIALGVTVTPADASESPDQPLDDSSVIRGISPDGPISAAQLAENELVNQEKLQQVSRQRAARSATAAAAATSNYLGSHHSAEAHYYWCGPAAVRSALLQRSVDVTQSPLATQLKTTAADGTAWRGVNANVSSPSGRPVRDVMNAREPGSWNYAAVDVPNHASATQATFRSNLTFNINANHPLVVGLYEEPNGAHLNGHAAASQVWHYVSLRGYSDSGANSAVDDPAAGSPEISWQASVPAQSEIGSPKLIKMMEPHGNQGSYGYVW